MPGIYWFKDAKKSVLYVGKAKNLKARLNSYRHQTSSKVRLFLKKTATVCVKTTSSELQALLLEASYINTYQPPYNARLKDDKSPLYIAITKEGFPRVLTLRKPQILNSKFKLEACYGPFPSGYQAQKLLKHLRHIFPFCSSLRPSRRPCFYYHLKLCPGVCAGKISSSAYRRHLHGLKLLLSGKTHTLKNRLTSAMHQAAHRQDFETAARLRNRLQLLNQITTASSSSLDLHLPPTPSQTKPLLKALSPFLPQLKHLHRIEGYDISNTQGLKATGSMVVFTNSQPDKSQYRRFKIRTKSTPDDTFMLREVLIRRLKHLEWGIPNLILIDGGPGQLNTALDIIGPKIPLLALAKKQEIVFTLKGQLQLPLSSPALHLLQSIRDQAHRFARSYHRHLRDRINI